MSHTQENLFTPGCIRTFTGAYVNVCNPAPGTIRIEDIAHSLSMQCRFGAHLPVFYSVAEHSLACCYNAAPEDKLAALLHDASEAYLLDIPSPVKRDLSNYADIEDRLMRVIAEQFGFEWPLSAAVKRLDEIELNWEWNHIMLSRHPPRQSNRRQVYKNFLRQFNMLIQP